VIGGSVVKSPLRLKSAEIFDDPTWQALGRISREEKGERGEKGGRGINLELVLIVADSPHDQNRQTLLAPFWCLCATTSPHS
jgi:hypothetical protein